jgi:transposase-like protein
VRAYGLISQAVLVAIAIDRDGRHLILAVDMGNR